MCYFFCRRVEGIVKTFYCLQGIRMLFATVFMVLRRHRAHSQTVKSLATDTTNFQNRHSSGRDSRYLRQSNVMLLMSTRLDAICLVHDLDRSYSRSYVSCGHNYYTPKGGSQWLAFSTMRPPFRQGAMPRRSFVTSTMRFGTVRSLSSYWGRM